MVVLDLVVSLRAAWQKGALVPSKSSGTLSGAAMEVEVVRSYSLEQVQPLCSFPHQQTMAEAPNMAVTAEPQMPAEVPAQDPVPGQDPVPEAPKRRKRKARAAELKDPVEPKKPAESKKSGKSTKSKEKQEKITDTFKVKSGPFQRCF